MELSKHYVSSLKKPQKSSKGLIGSHDEPQSSLNAIPAHELPENPAKNDSLDSPLGLGLEDGGFYETELLTLDENPEINDILLSLEKRFSRLEQRLETNELVHLHDEMQRLYHTEEKKGLAQEARSIQEVQSRLTTLEAKLERLEADLKSHKAGLDFKLEDFTHRIEQYLEKFVSTTASLAEKFDALVSIKNNEDTAAKDKFEDIHIKLEKLSEEVRDRLKILYDTIENAGGLAHQTSTALESEKYNMRK